MARIAEARAIVENLDQAIAVKSHEANVRAELGRVIGSVHFSKSPQLLSFLRFVVEETLAGRGDRIKAYSIAADALGRDDSFDPDHDPIVRVSAGRLRRSLHQYYSDGGCDDPIIIELPLGNYVPVFRANSKRRRARTRVQNFRHGVALKVQEQWRIVLLIVCLATGVSLTIDFMWMMTGHARPGFITVLGVPEPAVSGDLTGSLQR